MENERETLVRVRELIGQKKYTEARALLEAMPDNPTAQEWLAKLDDLVAKEAASPSSPARTGSSSPLSQIDMDQVSEKVQAALLRIEMDPIIAVKVLIVAAASGVLAGLLDAILGLPGGVLMFSFGWLVAALNGPAYAIWRGRIDKASVIASAVVGIVALLLWYIVVEIIVGEPDFEDSPYFFFQGIREEYMNLIDVFLTGAVVGLLSLGWYALLPLIPNRIEDLPGRKKE